MNNNYEWQTHQVNEQHQARLDEAATHRQLREGNGRSPFSLSLKMMVPVLVGVILVIWLLTGCTVDDSGGERPEDAATQPTGVTMADRIHFQDSLDLRVNREMPKNNRSASPWTMADRIHFQDSQDLHVNREMSKNNRPNSPWTMAERIHFQDRIWAQNH